MAAAAQLSSAGPPTSAGRDADSALRPSTTASGFVLPAIWSFPPFFTLQPNPATQAHQLALWSELVLGWARHDRVFVVNAESPEPGEVFANFHIQRRLLPASLRQLLTHMVAEGTAAHETKGSAAFLLYWRKPEEWGQIIYDWVSDNGMTGTIMTFYEITDGDLSSTTDFRGLPASLLRRSLDTLVKKGRAQLLRGGGDDGDGVRFL